MIDEERVSAMTTRIATWCEQLDHEIDAAGRVSEDVAAQVLGRSCGTLANWRATGVGPAYYRGTPVRYGLADLAAHIERQRTNYHEDSRIDMADGSATCDRRAK